MRLSNVEIIPNRRQIDDKFPALGFTVKTGGLPYYEVIVTTNRELFAPARSAERHAGNFFSSRQTNNQLQTMSGGDAVYMVPPSVLSSLAQNKPTAIFYTLIAYTDAAGSMPQFAHQPEMLSQNAPFVELAPTFSGQTLSRVLGISLDSLRRYESPSNGFQAATDALSSYTSSFETDQPEAEDGFSMMDGNGVAAGLEADEHHAEDGFELNQEQPASSQTYIPSPYESNGYHQPSNQFASDDYEDGFEEEFGVPETSYARMQESVFPAGAAEPVELYEDEGELYGESESFERAAEFSAPAYSASASLSGAQAAFSNNGLNHRNNGRAMSYGDYGEAYEDGFEDDQGEDYGESYSQYATRQLDDESIIYKAISGVGKAVQWVAVKAVEFAKKVAARKFVIEKVAFFESGGGKNPFKAINADQEFASWSWHEAYGKYHIGLSYGIVQFTQDGGSLGQLLKMMRGRDKTVFNKTFGGSALADELIRVTNATGDFSKDVKSGRSVRVQPVDGSDIWLSPWKERFEAAAEHPAFQAAQYELANTLFLETIIQFCVWFGFDTDRAVAMVYDRAVQMGVGGAKKWIAGAVGPVQTEALQIEALKALGKKDLKDFQRSVKGLDADGEWGPMTHAAMVSALRALGTASPIPIPTRSQMLDSMVRAASAKKWAKRVENLRNSTEFSDTEFPF